MAVITKDILPAVGFLKAGDVVAMPTETVYGLAANALNPEAIVKVYEVKERPRFNPLILHIGRKEDISKYAREIPEAVQTLIDRFWPGPLTFLLPKSELIDPIVTAGSDKVAIRMPAHPMALALLEAIDFPLVAPSANKFMRISPTNPRHVDDQLGPEIPVILDGGDCSIGIESTIIEILEDEQSICIHRLGGRDTQDIQQVLDWKISMPEMDQAPETPGQLKKHYAPAQGLRIGHLPDLIRTYFGSRLGVLSFKDTYETDVTINRVLSPMGSLQEAAANLFRYMRELETSGVDLILAERVPDEGIGKAINDRLKRASSE